MYRRLPAHVTIADLALLRLVLSLSPVASLRLSLAHSANGRVPGLYEHVFHIRDPSLTMVGMVSLLHPRRATDRKRDQEGC